MLFMGEEYAARTPFLYFCDFGPELAAAVAAGRREEFGRFAAFANEAARLRIPDPNGLEAFAASKLDDAERALPAHAEALQQTRAVLAVRRNELAPRFGDGTRLVQWSLEGDALRLVWSLGKGRNGTTIPSFLHLIANFGAADALVTWPPGRIIHMLPATQEAAHDALLPLAPGGVCASIEEAPDA
jgi:maltooligosyltrehalose trehalohydrolase